MSNNFESLLQRIGALHSYKGDLEEIKKCSDPIHELSQACQYGHLHVVKYFIEEREIPFDEELLLDAVGYLRLDYWNKMHMTPDVLRYLLDKFNPDIDLGFLLEETVRNNNYPITKYLTEEKGVFSDSELFSINVNRVDTIWDLEDNTNSSDPIGFPLENRRFNIPLLELLLDWGYDISEKDRQIFKKRNELKTYKYLIQ